MHLVIVAITISPLSFLIYKVADQYSPSAVSATTTTATAATTAATATAAASPTTPSAAIVQCTSPGETFCLESYFMFGRHLAIL